MTWEAGLSEVVRHLDSIGFDVGSSRISIYRAILIVLVVAGVFVAGRLASGVSRRIIHRITPLDAAERLIGEKIVSIIVWVIAILVGIDLLGINLTALTVFSGAFGLAIGFGLQKTFGNLIAGIILLMDRSIKPGDVIAVNDGVSNTVGQVKKIGIRAVSVITRDKKEYLIPNENLMINQVENWSYSSRDVRVKVPVSVTYDTDIAFAEALMLQAARETDRVLDNPAPSVWLHTLGENGIQFEIQIWIDDPEEGIGNVRSDVLKRLWALFRENGLRVPAPQRDIRLRDWPNDPLQVDR
ncbi:mechanosensitive ion channel family protein [Novosphingobium sp. JCM 18896]|uniref:mechanosensitive ion channel family protein n=1 Tax=Novosphingobium sp. JCM 18896 TaxID=2989731 RepID=UPI0029C9F153|nr:mechanosensitive ion channel domain-containing protein [Novosphingobium sp. JCM 18896]